jgi:hydroxymethylpyrimidine kinase/phosphomethylpyrimidine kinase/thiamine-phosphate diphosphorylase
MAKGADVPSAVAAAKRYVWRLLERSAGLPLGQGPNRPMNHGYRLADWRAELEQASSASAVDPGASGASAPPAFPRRLPNAVDVRVYAVTDAALIEASGLSLESAVRAALEGGATCVQLREKRCDGGRFAARAAAALAACRARGVPLLVNDRVDVALAVGADGVHVGQDDLPAAAVRAMIGPDMLLGVSVKTPAEAAAAEAAGADYLGAGAVYPTGTKDSSVIGLDALAAICAAVRIPVAAIGGVGAGNAAAAVGAGAGGVAVVSGIFGAPSPADAARELRAAVDGAAAAARRAGRRAEA